MGASACGSNVRIWRGSLCLLLLLGLAWVLRPAAAQTPTPAGVPWHCNGDRNGDGHVTVDEIVDAVNNALTDCMAPLATPAPNATLTYRLLEDSRITFVPAEGGSVVQEPLSGTFAAVRADSPAPNTLVAFTITDIAVQSAHYSVTGTGYFDVTTLAIPLQVFVHLEARINDAPIGMNGGGLYNTCDAPPTFRGGLEICGGAADRAVECTAIDSASDSGYSLMLFAVPEN